MNKNYGVIPVKHASVFGSTVPISKVGRFSEKDIEDIQILIEKGLLDENTFRQRAEESLRYYAGRLEPVQTNIDLVCERIASFVLKSGSNELSSAPSI